MLSHCTVSHLGIALFSVPVRPLTAPLLHNLYLSQAGSTSLHCSCGPLFCKKLNSHQLPILRATRFPPHCRIFLQATDSHRIVIYFTSNHTPPTLWNILCKQQTPTALWNILQATRLLPRCRIFLQATRPPSPCGIRDYLQFWQRNRAVWYCNRILTFKVLARVFRAVWSTTSIWPTWLQNIWFE